MTLVNNKMVVDVTNNCVCEIERGDGTLVPSEECFGCFDDMREELFSEILQPFMERNNVDEETLVRVVASGLTWERVSAEVVVSIASLRTGIFGQIRGGDWRVAYTLEADTLSAVRYSHDEPTGASMTFEILSEEGDC